MSHLEVFDLLLSLIIVWAVLEFFLKISKWMD